MKKFFVLIMIFSSVLCFSQSNPGAAALFEFTFGTGIRTDGVEVGIGMGLNKEDSFNLLFTFDGLFYYWYIAPGRSFEKINQNYHYQTYFYGDSRLGVLYEKYFSDTFGIMGQVFLTHLVLDGIRPKSIAARIGVPMSWSFGKITPSIEYDFYYNKLSFGVNFSVRNSMAGIVLVAMGGTQTKVGSVRDSYNNEIASIWMDDPVKRQQQQDAIAIYAAMGVEDKLPYPAWKYNTVWNPSILLEKQYEEETNNK